MTGYTQGNNQRGKRRKNLTAELFERFAEVQLIETVIRKRVAVGYKRQAIWGSHDRPIH